MTPLQQFSRRLVRLSENEPFQDPVTDPSQYHTYEDFNSDIWPVEEGSEELGSYWRSEDSQNIHPANTEHPWAGNILSSIHNFAMNQASITNEPVPWFQVTTSTMPFLAAKDKAGLQMYRDFLVDPQNNWFGLKDYLYEHYLANEDMPKTMRSLAFHLYNIVSRYEQ